MKKIYTTHGDDDFAAAALACQFAWLIFNNPVTMCSYEFSARSCMVFEVKAGANKALLLVNKSEKSVEYYPAGTSHLDVQTCTGFLGRFKFSTDVHGITFEIMEK